MTKTTTREQAVELRREGFSYSFIRDRLKVSKSTLNRWLKDVPFLPNNEFVTKVNRSHSELKDRRRQWKKTSENEARRQAVQDVGSISERDLMMLGLGIYMGEGGRSGGLRLVSSEAAILKAGVAWLKRVYGVPKEHFRVRIHLVEGDDAIKSREYWSKTLHFDLNQFYPEQIAKRQKSRIRNSGKSLYGTAHLTVLTAKKKELGVLLYRRILKSIEIAQNLSGLM